MKKKLNFAGKGFLDTTRIASGPPSVWHDILMTNPDNIANALDKLIKELNKIQNTLRKNNSKTLTNILGQAQSKRNELVKKKLRRKELPA